ncbi:hypothetical protein HZ989_05195 [Brevundimonas sp. AJA228-03]|nr:hypothetical protein HZ989_05195 [Brevundimonas sp. AJA228-03]
MRPFRSGRTHSLGVRCAAVALPRIEAASSNDAPTLPAAALPSQTQLSDRNTPGSARVVDPVHNPDGTIRALALFVR